MKLFERPALNPIFKREVLMHLRSPFMRWAAVIYLVGPFLAIVGVWPSGELYYGGSQHAENVFIVCWVCHLCMMIALMPVFGAFAISEEKENRTYEFLFTTLMPPWTISISKLFASLTSILILVICSMPVLSFIFYLGGVSPMLFSDVAGVLISAAVFLAVLSLFFSALFNKGYVALMATYLSLIPIGATVYFFLGWISQSGLSGGWMGQSGLSMKDLWIGLTLVLPSVAGVLMFWVFWMTRQPPAEKGRTHRKPIDNPEWLQQRRSQWPYYLIDPLRRMEPIPDGVNPVLAREQMFNPMFRSVWRWRLGYSMVIAFLLVCGVLGLNLFDIWAGSHEVDFLLNCFSLLIFLLVCGWSILVHAIPFAGEHEQRTIETLKLTDLTAREFLRGKWISCWTLRWPITLIALIMVAGFMFFHYSIYANSGRGKEFGFNEGTTVVSLSFILLEMASWTSSWMALRSKSVPRALIWTFLVVGLFVAVIWSVLFEGLPTEIHLHFEPAFHGWFRVFPWTASLAIPTLLFCWAAACYWGIVWQVHKLWRT